MDAARARRGTGYPTGCDGCIFLFGSAGDAVAAAVEAQRALATEPWPGGTYRPGPHGDSRRRGRRGGRRAVRHGAPPGVPDHGGHLRRASRRLGHGGRAHRRSLRPASRCSTWGSTGCATSCGRCGSTRPSPTGIATAFPPLKTAASGASRLPAPTTSFVGRERELRELVDLLAARRLVTLTGVGGSGKTRLALEVARRVAERYRDGVRLVELAGLARRDALVPAGRARGARHARAHGRAVGDASSCAPRWRTATSSSCSTTASTSSPGWPRW